MEEVAAMWARETKRRRLHMSKYGCHSRIRFVIIFLFREKRAIVGLLVHLDEEEKRREDKSLFSPMK